MKGLMKQAASLPRFALDCGFWRTRRYAGVSPAVVGLQTAAVSYCHEHGTDGWIPNDGLAAALGFKERDVVKLIPEMLRRDLWVPAYGDGFAIVGYLDHNPSRADVRRQRAKRAAAGVKANHDRWHQDRSDSECPHCSEDDPLLESESDPLSESDVGSEADSQEKRREEKRREENSDGLPSPFDRFWSAYPRREGKLAAQKAWPKAVKHAGGAEVIIQGALRFAADPNREPQFTPHPGPWLNAGRWLDEPLPAKVDRNGNVRLPVNPDLADWQRP